MARRGCGAIQIGAHGRLIEVFETWQVNAVRTVVADIEEHGVRQLPLDVQAPLLRVGRLVVDGHSGLNGKWGRSGQGRSAARGIIQGCAVYVEVSKKTLAEAYVQLWIAELEAVVEEHAVAEADRCFSIAEGVPRDAEARRDGFVEFFADFAAERRLRARKTIKGWRIGEDQAIQWIEIGIAGARAGDTIHA